MKNEIVWQEKRTTSKKVTKTFLKNDDIAHNLRVIFKSWKSIFFYFYLTDFHVVLLKIAKKRRSEGYSWQPPFDVSHLKFQI